MSEYIKWVACWGNATSITDRKESVWAKDITLRYPIRVCFSGAALRLRFSNLTGNEPVTLTRVFVARQKARCYQPLKVMFGGLESVTIAPGTEVESEVLNIDISAGEMIDVSIYLGEFTQMNAGTLITGPLSKGKYSYGNFAEEQTLPLDLTRNTNWFYFLNTIDILTEPRNRALVCYGDSITAQSWPDYLAIELWERGVRDVSVIRRAVSGTRILRQYDCITYAAYGLKGATRFPIELNVAGAWAVILQHGINDIIHPVGKEVNVFRPWSDMPTTEDLQRGIEEIYVQHARQRGLLVLSGTLLPIEGWRTYNEERDAMRCELNEWLCTSPIFDGCIDFDAAVCNPMRPQAFGPGMDSGDHLHPSEKAYERMAHVAADYVIKNL